MNLFIFGIFRFRCRCRFRFSLLGSVPNKKVKGRAFPGMSCIRKKTKVKMFLLEKNKKDGSGCGTVAEHTSCAREALGSNHTICFFLLFSSLTYQQFVLKQDPQYSSKKYAQPFRLRQSKLNIEQNTDKHSRLGFDQHRKCNLTIIK